MKLAIFAAAALFLFSCVSQPPGYTTAPPFKSIAFVTSQDLPEFALPESEREVFDRHINAGAAAGTLSGVAVGAAACGPVLYGVCVAIMSWYGLVAGSVGGAALGLYKYSGLSDTDSAYIELVLSGINDRRDFHSDLMKQVELRVSTGTIAGPQDADIQVVIWVDRINFVEVEKELVSTEMYGTMAFARAGEEDESVNREVF